MLIQILQVVWLWKKTTHGKWNKDIIRIYKIQPDNFIYFSNAIKE